MNGIPFDKKLHMKRLPALRRGMAALLTLAMLCPMLPFDSHAAAAVAPIQKTTNLDASGKPDGSGETPTITIEVNGVIDQANHLTGFVEVAIRAKPALLHLTADNKVVPSTASPGYDHSEIQPFASMGVALEYSPKLTPWEWEKTNGSWEKLDPAQDPTQAVDLTDALDVGFSSAGMAEVDALHKKTRIAHAAVSAKADADGNADGVDFNDGGYLYLMAGGFDSKAFSVGVDSVTGLPVAEDTVLAVVRFKYELDENDENKNPWSTMFPKGKKNPDVTNWIDPRNPDGWLVRIADEAVVDDPDDPIIDWELTYDSGKSQARPNGNGFYYSTDITDGREAYNPALNPGDVGYSETYTNCMDVALVDTTAAVKSTTNVVPGVINYTLVNRLSYNFSGGDPDDYATILFYDWDDTLMGTLVVDKDLDSRDRVNQFVRENFIYSDGNDVSAGDDTNLSLQDNTAAAVSSLQRKDNYRGKYDWLAPGPDVTTPVVADGEDYPLTNKLDYVFFKRPMVNDESKKPDETDTAKYPGGAADPQYLEDLAAWRETCYIQATDDTTGDPIWDTELPYIHGWAVVEDFAHPEEVWTTLGAGELLNYTDYRTTPNCAATPQTTPAAFQVDGGTLVFADFDFGKHPISGATFAVKAVYEQGEDLLVVDSPYRMVKVPYFNKLNSASASIANAEGLFESNGGAYSAQMTFERSSFDDTKTNIHGAVRLRDPAVRQDTTTDLRWETDDALGVNHDLTNADNNTAYTTRAKTTYTKVDVTNTEQITFTLALSALQNKVNYYFIDQYASNFVVGTGRSASDQTRGDGENIPDNYNYLTTESDNSDDYYDAAYADREGTHGFVLYGTLNNLLEKAISDAHGATDFNEYVTNETMADANLRHPATGDPATSNNASRRTAMRNAIKEAAKQAETHVGQPDEALYWDAEHGHPKLNYHQLQWFITDYILNGSATLMTPSAANAQKISWCHLHTSCAGVSSKPINNWQDLMEAAADYVYTPNSNALDQLLDTFGLRQGITATPFATRNDMKTALINAVTALKNNGVTQTEVEGLTWTQVQFFLDEGVATTVTTGAIPSDTDITDPDGAYKKDYWWTSTGTGKKTISSWQELLEIYYHIKNDSYFEGDSTTSGWWSEYTLNDKLDGSVRDKDSNGDWLASGTPYAILNVALRKDDDGKPFDDMPQFQGALDTALGLLDSSYPNGEFDGISLMEIQHSLLGKPYVTEPELMGGLIAPDPPLTPVNPPVDYWWITGVKAPTTLKELVDLVDKVNMGTFSDDVLDVVTAETVAKAPFWLRSDADGKAFATDAALRSALKTAVAAWKSELSVAPTDLLVNSISDWPNAGPKNDPGCNWDDPAARKTFSQLQKILIDGSLGGDLDPDPAPAAGANYKYWWYGDGHKPITNLPELLEAAWNTWGTPGGTSPTDSADPNAMDALTDLDFITGFEQTDPASIDTSKYVYFRKNTDGDPFDSLDDFKTALKAATQVLAGRNPDQSYTAGQDWIVVQHLLLGNGYRSQNQLRNDPDIDYWWENGGKPPAPSTVDYTWADGVMKTISEKASDIVLNYNGTANDLADLITDTMARALNIKASSTGNAYTRTELVNALIGAMEDFRDNHQWSFDTDWENDLFDGTNMILDWRSFQEYVVNGDMLNLSSTSESDMNTTYGIDWAPSASIEAGVDYTAADACVAALSGILSQAADTNGSAAASDLPASFTDVMAKDLGLKYNGSDCTTAAQVGQMIADAVNDFWPHLWSFDTDWENDLWDGGSTLSLDWKSLQYWAESGGVGSGAMDNLSGKTYDEMKNNYGISWYPPNDPDITGMTSMSNFSLRAPMKKAPAKGTTDETTEVVKSGDGLQTVTVTTRTTTNPATGITTIVKTEKTVLDLGDRTVETTNVTTMAVNTTTGAVDSHTDYGTPEVTLKADLVTPKPPVGPDDPIGPTEDPDDPTEDPADDPVYDMAPDVTPVTPDEATDHDDDNVVGGNVGRDDLGAPNQPDGTETPDETPDTPATYKLTPDTVLYQFTREDEKAAAPAAEADPALGWEKLMELLSTPAVTSQQREERLIAARVCKQNTRLERLRELFLPQTQPMGDQNDLKQPPGWAMSRDGPPPWRGPDDGERTGYRYFTGRGANGRTT